MNAASRFFTRRQALLAGAALSLASGPLRAQTWPTKPIRLLLGYAPGGGADITARELAAPLSKLLGQPVVVDYKVGASGTIAAAELARAAPDGYTLALLDNAPLTIVPALRNAGYDPLSSFTPLSMVTQLPQVLVANPSLPANSAAELLALLRKSPGRFNFASGGSGSVSHLAAELFKARSNTFAVHVPYRGGAPAVTAVIAGEAQFAFLTLAVTTGFIKSGQLKALGVTSTTRLAALPQVPTIAEQGLAGYEAPGWFALMAPAGLPAALAATLEKAVVSALDQPGVAARLEGLGQTLAAGKVAPRDTIANEFKTWKKLIQERKLTVEA